MREANRLKLSRSQGSQRNIGFLLTLLIFNDVPNGSVSYERTEVRDHALITQISLFK